MAKRQSCGVTLIELLVTVSIAVVMAMIAAPSLQAFTRSAQLRTATNDLAVALVYARSESIKRGWPVTVCKSSSTAAVAPSCNAAASWQQGWLVFVDLNQNGALDVGDAALRIGTPDSTALTVAGGANFSSYVTFRPSGFPLGNGGAESGSFTFCLAPDSRVLNLSKTGRSQISSGSC